MRTQTLHTRMGDAYFRLGQLDEAETSYHRSLEFGEELYATAGLVCLSSERGNLEQGAHFFWLLFGGSNISNPIELLSKRFIRSGQQEAMLKLFRYLLAVGKGDRAVLDELETQLEQFS